jgi:inner membrane protein
MTFGILRSNSIVGKSLVIGVIVLLLMLPLTMLRDLVSERSQMRDQAFSTVAQGWGGELIVSGPMLVVPMDRQERNDKGIVVTMRRHLYVLPSQLQIDVELIEQSDKRRVGIYQVPVYLARARISGEFAANAIAAAVAKNGPDAAYRYERGRLRIPLSETRSLRELKTATLNGKALSFSPAQPGIYNGIETDLDLNAIDAKEALKFSFEVVLAGSRDFSVLPLGAITNVSMTSAWPDPKFVGAFLPTTRTIGTQGFNAKWQVLELNRSYGDSWIDCNFSDQQLGLSAFGVQLFQSVDVYQRSERAVKYALLFIALTFLSFFAWEQVSKVAVHPMQYLLIGLALSTFYLLLIALTEHVPFFYAYWTSAAALVSLLGIYTASSLHGFSRGLAVGAAMALTYAVLFMLVLSEQYSLLMGAIVLFVALAAVMLVTRKVEWYRGQG